MKKFIFILILILSLTFVAGCDEDGNTIRFNPDRNEATLESANDEEGSEEEANIEEEATILEVTSIPDKELETNVGYHVIRGTTPKNSHKIVVNNYTLTKYYPGQTEWSYIAAKSLGTLKEGNNSYTVVAFDAAGNAIDSETFKIDYTAVSAPTLPDTGNSLWITFLMSLIGLGIWRRLECKV